jgi:uncharacterized protein YkwD
MNDASRFARTAALGLFALLPLLAACSDDTASGGVGAGGSTATGSSEPTEVAGITAAHNAVRAGVTPAASPALPALVWSPELGASAQAYADKCVFGHSDGKYGENLFAGTGLIDGKKEIDGTSVVEAWAGESAHYTYETNGCSSGEACGHYTQIVWRDSAKLGCGRALCKTGSPFGDVNGGEWQNWVCQYDPPGNYVGEKPY